MTERRTKRGSDRDSARSASAPADPSRTSRIESIRKAVQEGTYKVSSAAIATAILQRMRQPQGAGAESSQAKRSDATDAGGLF